MLRPRAPGAAPPKALFIEVPFKAPTRPSVGLSLLKACLARAGFDSTIRYANAEFLSVLGADAYHAICDLAPQEFLLGDLVFAPSVDPALGDCEPLRRRGTHYLQQGGYFLTQVPAALWDRIPSLQQSASAFVERLAGEIARGDEEIIGFSCMFQTVPSLALAKRIKALAPEKYIVFGGSHCEGDMGLALHEQYPFIDFLARGESEKLIVDLVAALADKAVGSDAIAGLQGLVWRGEDGSTQANGDLAEPVSHLDDLPRIDYLDWLQQLAAWAPDLRLDQLWVPLESARGCWYGAKHHCTFCGLNGNTMAFRSKSPARVLDEIASLAAYRIPNVFTVDEILDHAYFDTVLPALAKKPTELILFYEVKSNLDRRQMEILQAARVLRLQPGIESLSSPVLKLMRKGVSAYQNVRMLKWGAELGITIWWNLLYGFPGERAEDYEEMAALLPAISHLNPPLAGCYKVRIDRFSPLHKESHALGVGDVVPVPAYALVHAAPGEMLARLAYNFEPARDDRSFDYMVPMQEAVEAWRAAFGESSLTGLHRNGELHLFDRRPIAVEPVMKLSPLERAVYLACDAGATLAGLTIKTGHKECDVQAALDEFVRRRLVVALDGRYLSLAVMLDGKVREGVREGFLPTYCHALHCKRMDMMYGRQGVGAAPRPERSRARMRERH